MQGHHEAFGDRRGHRSRSYRGFDDAEDRKDRKRERERERVREGWKGERGRKVRSEQERGEKKIAG